MLTRMGWFSYERKKAIVIFRFY